MHYNQLEIEIFRIKLTIKIYEIIESSEEMHIIKLVNIIIIVPLNVFAYKFIASMALMKSFPNLWREGVKL